MTTSPLGGRARHALRTIVMWIGLFVSLFAFALAAPAAFGQPPAPAAPAPAAPAPAAPTTSAAPAPVSSTPACKQPKPKAAGVAPAPPPKPAAAGAVAPAHALAPAKPAPLKVALKTPVATQQAANTHVRFCALANMLAADKVPAAGANPGSPGGLYVQRSDAATALKNKRAEKAPSAQQIEDAKASVDALDKQIGEVKAAFDAVDPEKQGVLCDQACVKSQVVTCKTSAATGGGALATTASAGISWQTALITGLAQFLSDRAQQELVLWLVTQLQTEICGNKEIEPLFPETCTVLDPACGYSQLPPGTVLASAIRTDIETLPAHVLTTYLHLTSDTANAIVDLFKDMRQGHSPLELIAAWSDAKNPLLTDCQGGQDPLACGMVIAGAIVANAGDVTSGDPNATVPAAAKLVVTEANKVIMKMCPNLDPAATAAQKASPPAGCVNLSLLDPVGDLSKVQTLLRAIADLATKIDQLGKSSGSASDKAVQMLNAAKLVLDAGAAFFPDLPLSPGAQATVKVVWTSVDDAIDATTSMISGQYADGVAKIVAFVRDVGTAGNNTLPDPVPRYLTLIVDISNAKTSADVQTALNGAAAPVGSWRDKRNAFSVSITGLVGLAGGYELPLSTGSGARVGSWSGGLMGAVGLDLSFPIPNNSTAGIFVSVLDVGQLITTPISPQAGPTASNGSTSTAAAGTNFQLVQVFSPGGYLRFGLGNSPFVLGLGGAVAPNLRIYQTAGGMAPPSQDTFSMFRFNAFLAIDVTMFPIAHKIW